MEPDKFLDTLKEKSVLIAQQEEHLPTLFIAKEEGVVVLPLAGLEKYQWRPAIETVLASCNPDFYAMVIEAYVAKFEGSEGGQEKAEEAARVGISNLPTDDRKDILMITLFENKGKARFLTTDVYPEREKRGVVGTWREEAFTSYESTIAVVEW